MDAVVKEWCIDSSIRCRCSIIRCSTDRCIVCIESTKRNGNIWLMILNIIVALIQVIGKLLEGIVESLLKKEKEETFVPSSVVTN